MTPRQTWKSKTIILKTGLEKKQLNPKSPLKTKKVKMS